MKPHASHQVCRWLSLAGALLTAGLLLADAVTTSGPVYTHIALHLQLPLVLTAILVGASLAVSGATLQIALHNPLADPGIIGISSGASLMAAILLLIVPAAWQLNYFYWLPLTCFAGALLSTWLIYRVARRLHTATTAVILAGVAISTVASALMGWLYLAADAQALRNLTFWLMGSLYQTDWYILALAGPVMIGALVYLLAQRRQLNWLYGGASLAQAAGTQPQKLIRNSLIASALAVGAAVSVAGSVAFVGLLVPHFLRMLIGFDHRYLLPACAAGGAVVLLLVATLSEAYSGGVLPVSMITASVGGPLLLVALYRGQWKSV